MLYGKWKRLQSFFSLFSLVPPSANTKRDRTGSLRFANRRPVSAQQHGRGSPGGTNGRTQSVSHSSRHRNPPPPDINVAGTIPGPGARQLELVRSMDTGIRREGRGRRIGRLKHK